MHVVNTGGSLPSVLLSLYLRSSLGEYLCAGPLKSTTQLVLGLVVDVDPEQVLSRVATCKLVELDSIRNKLELLYGRIWGGSPYALFVLKLTHAQLLGPVV